MANLGVARHIGDDVELQRRVGNLVVDGRRQSLAVERQKRDHGLDCAGSSVGLMVAFFGLGLMSVWWMAAVAAVVFAQKVARFGARLAVPAGLALIVVGLIDIA